MQGFVEIEDQGEELQYLFSIGYSKINKRILKEVCLLQGIVEIEDQVEGLQYLFLVGYCVDMIRVGIYGWFYGGYFFLLGIV